MDVPRETIVFAIQILLELALGFILGMVMNFFFYIVQLAGLTVDTQMGMTMNQIYDAGAQSNLSVTGEILNVLMTLLFFAANGHHTLLRMMVTSGQIVGFGGVAIGPESAEELMKDEKNLDFSDADGFTEGIALILKHLQNQFGDILRQRLQGAVSVLLVVVLCAALENTGGKQPLFLSMAGALSITVLTAGSLDMLIGLGAETIQELNLFSKALLPTLAAATAASGAITTATFQQVSTVFFADLLMNLINGLLMPMVYLYIGAMTAGACMSESRLWTIAEGLKKAITWILTSSLLLFTVYLSVVRVISAAT